VRISHPIPRPHECLFWCRSVTLTCPSKGCGIDYLRRPQSDSLSPTATSDSEYAKIETRFSNTAKLDVWSNFTWVEHFGCADYAPVADFPVLAA